MKRSAARIGHNDGPPLDPGRSWRRHCWKQAHKELWKPLPVEVVRRRVTRAARLGLSYRRYAIILLCGSDIEGFLFASGTVVGGTGAAAGRDRFIGKLAAISGCQRLLLASRKDTRRFEREDPECRALLDGLIFVPSPTLLAGRPSMPDRDAVRAALLKQGLAARTVVLVGTGESGQVWVAASRLAGFVTAGEYFTK